MPHDIVAQLLGPRALAEARAEMARVRAHGVALHTLESADYPELLRHAFDPPFVVASRGSLTRVPERTVSLVGSRAAGDFERHFARELARDLASCGVVVASGLAKGIDREAHEGALEVPGGQTVAVLGCGLARIYPSEHADLAGEIVERGALLTELPMDAPPRKHHFPQRNRIVSGIAKATVVIAAGEHSGALITAKHAHEQDREIFTIPGRLDEPLARGTNNLLKLEMARLIEGADDVLERLGWKEAPADARSRPPLVKRVPRPPLPGIPGDVEALLASGRGRTFEELAGQSKLEPRVLLVALGRLQGLGRVRARGALFELTS